MLHSIPAGQYGPFDRPMTHAVEACVHCGFCLAACPTYQELGQEMDSPRGRIVLMKEVLEGTLPWEAAQPHVDRCLGCLACEPACPSGVPYRDLISPFRALAHEKRKFKRSAGERLVHFLAAATLPFPDGFGPRPSPEASAGCCARSCRAACVRCWICCRPTFRRRSAGRP